MGLPINTSKGQGCTPVSSNCVIWQGPDIPCIDLCAGDSVTDVVFKLATELCAILDTLNIKTYDLECFAPICPDPQNFHDMLQFLITKVCELQCCCDGKKPIESACPDACIVNIADCFYFTNQLGDQITTMTLPDYVTAIGNKLCKLIANLGILAGDLTTTNIVVAAQGARIITLEEEVASLTIQIPNSCLLGTGPFPIQDVVTNLETAFCNQVAILGSNGALLGATTAQCANLANSPQLNNKTSSMGSISGWITPASTIASNINNMWLAICDIRAAVRQIQTTCCCTDCDDVIITMTATLDGNSLTFFFYGSMPTGMTDCSPQGDWVNITDGEGFTYGVWVPVAANINSSVTISLASSGLNLATNLTINMLGCWTRATPGTDCGGLECARTLNYTIVNTAPCPVLTLDPITPNEVTWRFLNAVVPPGSYSIALHLSSDLSVVSTQGGAIPAVGATVTNTFSSLLCATNYYLQATITLNGVDTLCPPVTFTTQICPCVAPSAVDATSVTP